MELDFVLFADSVEPAEGQKLDIHGAIWDTISAPSVPAHEREMSIVVRVIARVDEALESHTLELVLLDSNEDEIQRLSGAIDPISREDAEEADLKIWKFLWAVSLTDVVFPAFDSYEFSVRVDGIELGRSQLFIEPTD